MPEQFEQRLQRLREAQNDPEAMALVVLDFLLDAKPASDRDLLVQAFEAAAVPHWFNVSILMKLLNQTEDKVTSLVQTLRQIPMVEDFGDSRSGNLNVHETTRLALRKRLHRLNPDRLRTLSAAAFEALNNETSAQVVAERLYHRMTAAPDQAAKECETLFRDFPNTATPEVQHSVGAVLEELENGRMLSGRARAEALLLIGWIRYIRGEITQQRASAEEALRIATELDHKSAVARALCLIGDVAKAIGNIRNAQDSYAKSIGIFLSLSSIDGSDAGLKRDLTLARSRLASALQPQGRLNEALVEVREGLQMLSGIATDEDNDGLKVSLSVINSQLGGLLQEQGKLSNAVAAIRASLALLEILTGKEPTNKSWQHRLSGVQGQLGGILQDQGHTEAALDAYTRSLDIAERVRLADPSSVNSNLQVSIACSRLGGLLQEKRETAKALFYYDRAFSLLEQMCRWDRENAQWQREWAVIGENIGGVQQASGERARAAKFFRFSLNKLQELVQRDPSNVVWRRDLATAYGLLGEALDLTGETALALLHLNKSVDMCRSLVELDTTNASSERTLAIAYFRVGHHYRRKGSFSLAYQSYARYIGILRKLASIDPTYVRAQRDVAIALQHLAALNRERGQAAQAQASNLEATSIFKKLAEDHPENPRWRTEFEAARQLSNELTV